MNRVLCETCNRVMLTDEHGVDWCTTCDSRPCPGCSVRVMKWNALCWNCNRLVTPHDVLITGIWQAECEGTSPEDLRFEIKMPVRGWGYICSQLKSEDTGLVDWLLEELTDVEYRFQPEDDFVCRLSYRDLAEVFSVIHNALW